MRNYYYRLYTLIALAGLGLLVPAAGAGVDDPAASSPPITINAFLGNINGKPVFVEDILRPLDHDLRQLAIDTKKDGLMAFKSEAGAMIARKIDALIDDILVADSAAQSLNDDDKQRIEPELNRFKKQLLTDHGGSPAALDEYLRSRGTTLDKVLSEKRQSIERNIFISKVIMPRVQVTRQLVLADYNQHLQDTYTVAPAVEMFTITVPVAKWLQEPDPDHDGKTRLIAQPTEAQVRQAVNLATEWANDLIKQLQAGADFADVAEQNSSDSHARNGGRWPTLNRGTLASKAMEDEAFSLKANSIGQPLLVNGADPRTAGVVIIKVGDVTPGHIVPFTEVQEKIYETLKKDQFNTLANDYLRVLREKAKVEGVDRMTQTAIDAAAGRYMQ